MPQELRRPWGDAMPRSNRRDMPQIDGVREKWDSAVRDEGAPSCRPSLGAQQIEGIDEDRKAALTTCVIRRAANVQFVRRLHAAHAPADVGIRTHDDGDA